MKTLLTAYLFIFSVHFVFAQNYLVWDKTGINSTYGESLFTLNQVIHNAKDNVLKPKLFTEDTPGKKIAGIGYRFSKFIILDFQLDALTALIQHEAFGHGFYYREYGYKDNFYHISLAPPFGKGNGIARKGRLETPRVIGRHENISIEYGGAESCNVMSNIILKKWMLAGEMEFDETILFIGTNHNTSGYILGSDYDDKIKGDMLDYLTKINQYHGFTDVDDYPLTLKYLKRRAWIEILNPINLYTSFLYTWKYIGKGEKSVKMPFIKILGYQYFPNFDLNLNPFGSELVVTNFLRNDRNLITGEIRIGDNKLAKSLGGGLGYSQIWSNRPFQFDASLDLWNQDELELGGESLKLTEASLGGAARFGANIRLLNGDKPIYFHTQLGYKTSGYLHGQFLREGLIWRIGLSFNEL